MEVTWTQSPGDFIADFKSNTNYSKLLNNSTSKQNGQLHNEDNIIPPSDKDGIKNLSFRLIYEYMLKIF